MCLILLGLAGCLSPPAGTDGGSDAGPPGRDAAADGQPDGGAVDCETLLADDFEGESVDLDRWREPYIEPYAAVSMTGGQLRIAAGAFVADEGGYAQLESKIGYDSALTVFRMAAVPMTSMGSEVSLTFYDPEADKHVGLQIGYGNTSVVIDDVPLCSGDCPALITGSRVFRVTDDGESIRFEVDAGGDSWTLLGQTESIISSMTSVELSAYADPEGEAEWVIEELSWMQCL